MKSTRYFGIIRQILDEKSPKSGLSYRVFGVNQTKNIFSFSAPPALGQYWFCNACTVCTPSWLTAQRPGAYNINYSTEQFFREDILRVPTVQQYDGQEQSGCGVSGHRPIVVVALRRRAEPARQVHESLAELADLAQTLGWSVAGRIMQSREAPDPHTYIGAGKLDDIRQRVDSTGAEVVVFDSELAPAQGRNLEQALGCPVMDRTQLILEIFAQHARSAEATTQVELARLQYLLPRLTGMWGHLDRERGGIGASRGMGEKQLSVDRQIIRRRIHRLKGELEKIASSAATQKKRRSTCLQCCLIGYTNAGKSTLLNLLTGSSVGAEDRLFATLDSTTRVLHGPGRPQVLLSDTVGFIRNLPHDLVASFRSTLAVIRDADLLIHVVDAGHAARDRQIGTTLDVLREIGACEIPRLKVFTKADLCTDEITRLVIEKKYPGSLLVSARWPEARVLVAGRIRGFFRDRYCARTIRLPYARSACLAELYARGVVGDVRYEPDAVYVQCTLSRAQMSSLAGVL